MNTGKLVAKKSKKRRASDDLSSDEYEEKRVEIYQSKTGKLRKASKTNKREEPKKKSDKGLEKYGLESSSDSDSDGEQTRKRKVNYVPIQLFNPDKIFTEILNKASKEPDFLIMLKNLLSGCSRVMNDKKNMYIKKWRTLRSSNCNQDEYLSRQAELKRAQNDDKLEMQRDIMTKLSYANIKGFQTRSSLIQNYKREIGAKNPDTNGEGQEWEIDDEVWEKYYEAQKKLLAMMMKENDFVSQDYTPSNLIKTYSENIKEKQMVMKEQVFEDNELGLKFNNIDSEENPAATQFLFCKHYKEIDYDKVFFNGLNSFKPVESEKFYIEPKAMSWLLELKSDEIYQNETFQKDSYRKYNELLKQLYQNPENFSEAQIISHLLEVAAYILNAVHYYQKFKLKCDLLHPLDLLLVIQKIKRLRKKSTSKQQAMVDQKYEQLEKQAISINEIYNQIANQY